MDSPICNTGHTFEILCNQHVITMNADTYIYFNMNNDHSMLIELKDHFVVVIHHVSD